MSELTICNHCTFKFIKGRMADNEVVTYQRRTVWVHPKDVEIPRDADPDDPHYKPYFRAWFMELTNHCVC